MNTTKLLFLALLGLMTLSIASRPLYAGYSIDLKEQKIKVTDVNGRPLSNAAIYQKVSIWGPALGLGPTGRLRLEKEQSNLIEKVFFTDSSGEVTIPAVQLKSWNPTKSFAEAVYSFEGVKGPCELDRPTHPVLKELFPIVNFEALQLNSRAPCYLQAMEEETLGLLPQLLSCMTVVDDKTLNTTLEAQKKKCH